MIRNLREKVRISIAVLIAFFCLYGVAFGIINYISGSNVVGGDGLIKSVNGMDTLHVVVGIGLEIDNDSVTVDETSDFTWTGTHSFTGATISFPADAVGDADIDWGTGAGQVSTDDITEGSSNLFDQALPDSSNWSTAYSWGDHSTQNYLDEDDLGNWKVFYSNGTGAFTELTLGSDGTYLKSNGATSAPTWDTPGGAGDMLKSTYDVDEDGDIDQAAGGLEADVSAYTGLIGLASGTVSEIDTKVELEGMLDNVNAGAICLRDSIMTISANWVNTVSPWADNEVANDISIDEADDVDTTGTKIAAALANRVAEYDQFWGGAELAIRTGSVDEIGIQYPLSNDSNGYFVRHVHKGTTADEADTVVFAGYLPIGIDGNNVDSIVYNMKTSYPADSVYVQVKVFKRVWGIGTLAYCDSAAATATTAGAWEHKTTGALEVATSAGEFIEIWFIVTFPSQTINVVLADHDKPKVWYTGK